MRFESSLYFGNVERFRSAFVAITGHDPTIKEEKPVQVKSDNGELVESNKGSNKVSFIVHYVPISSVF